jgi:phosphoribosylaminoimidazole-succinocarboxamide synthase
VLNQTSAWWFEATAHIVQNALLSTPDPNVALMRKCAVFPVEFVCRGYLTGGCWVGLGVCGEGLEWGCPLWLSGCCYWCWCVLSQAAKQPGAAP